LAQLVCRLLNRSPTQFWADISNNKYGPRVVGRGRGRGRCLFPFLFLLLIMNHNIYNSSLAGITS
jgi:hypothetical protein